VDTWDISAEDLGTGVAAGWMFVLRHGFLNGGFKAFEINCRLTSSIRDRTSGF
jgi:hypothetical protein